MGTFTVSRWIDMSVYSSECTHPISCLSFTVSITFVVRIHWSCYVHSKGALLHLFTFFITIFITITAGFFCYAAYKTNHFLSGILPCSINIVLSCALIWSLVIDRGETMKNVLWNPCTLIWIIHGYVDTWMSYLHWLSGSQIIYTWWFSQHGSLESRRQPSRNLPHVVTTTGSRRTCELEGYLQPCDEFDIRTVVILGIDLLLDGFSDGGLGLKLFLAISFPTTTVMPAIAVK